MSAAALTLAAAGLAGLAACPAPGGARPTPPARGDGGAGSAMASSGSPDGPGAVPAPAAHEPSQEERLAAIQKAMNELDEGAQGCWAAAAVDRFDIAGELAAMIEVEPATARVTIARDTTRTP
ncbi:MAG TPA: hypothetical protein VN253_26635, partial [Kofleriaceae bacterium]|nr:hypothetical protein [Kofleriaceae bacterium]